MWLIGLTLIAVALIAPWWAIVQVRRQRRELRALRERLERLETRAARGGDALSVVPAPAPSEPRVPSLPAPIPLAAMPAAPVASHPTPAPSRVPGPVPGPAAARRGFDSSRAEELVGSVWLQNIGAVLLLLGMFFLILWGYTTGRFGPGVLVAAGVALGLAFAWRGDRMARTLPLLGHALIGVGLGTIYLSLYLGHFTLHALPESMAFLSLPAVAIGTVVVGLRYRVQSIAALGVLGAFVPQLMAAWIPLQGFSMSPPALLGYLSAVSLVVFLLSARAGWSGLDLAALLLTALTWVAQQGTHLWSWRVEGGLAALFVALGLSPLPRLVRREDMVRGIDLAVIALAPFALVMASWPILASSLPRESAALLAALAIAYLVAALWVDARRPERDLWQPLTGAAIMFVTAALERMLGHDRTPLAWCVEGTVLMCLGLRPRGEWLRTCGTLVAGLGAAWLLRSIFTPWSREEMPVVHPGGLRALAGIAALMIGAVVSARGRARLTAEERHVPELWSAIGNLLLCVWIGREASHLASALAGEGGPWARATAQTPTFGPTFEFAAMFMSVGWLLQALALVAVSRPPGRSFPRGTGYVIATLGAAAWMAHVVSDGWTDAERPILHPIGVLALASIGVIAVMSVLLAGARPRLGAREVWTPEISGMAASLLLMMWIAAEAIHLARALQAPAIETAGAVERRELMMRIGVLSASFTSAGWLIEALAMLGIGWIGRSAFLRWSGLGLAGLTVLKFLMVDLQAVDVFWRFLTAIVVGAALLGVSYAYQRRARARRERAS